MMQALTRAPLETLNRTAESEASAQQSQVAMHELNCTELQTIVGGEGNDESPRGSWLA
jgi:hypothetical protein